MAIQYKLFDMHQDLPYPIISPSGEIVSKTQWWKPEVLEGKIPLRDDITFFVAHGDITGRVCTFLFVLLLLALIVRFRSF